MSEDPPYEAALVHPDGESTVARLAATAGDYGFEGVVVRNADAAEFDPAAVAEEHGADVVTGVEIDAEDPSTAAGRLGSVRSGSDTDYTVVAAAGGSEAMNRFAAGSDRVDVLTRPLRGEGAFDHVTADDARKHGVRVEFDLSVALRRRGAERARALSDLRRLREIVRDRNAPFVVSARPESHLQFRAPRELRAVGEAVGFDPTAIAAGLAEWGRLARRNRERTSESFIEPGVERGRYEADDS